MTPEQALACIEQERLDVLAEGMTEEDCNRLAPYVLASAYRRLLKETRSATLTGSVPLSAIEDESYPYRLHDGDIRDAQGRRWTVPGKLGIAQLLNTICEQRVEIRALRERRLAQSAKRCTKGNRCERGAKGGSECADGQCANISSATRASGKWCDYTTEFDCPSLGACNDLGCRRKANACGAVDAADSGSNK